MNKKIVIGITGLAVIALNSVVFYAASAANTPKSVATSSAIKGAKWNPTVKLTYSKALYLCSQLVFPTMQEMPTTQFQMQGSCARCNHSQRY